MAYTPPYLTQPGPQSSFTEYFPCDYCKGPLGADSTAHCRGCGAPLQKVPPVFNIASIYPPQDLIGWSAGSLQNKMLWEQMNLGNRQPGGLGNALSGLSGLGGRW